MKAFNSEKELRKIQKGNKNKILYGIIAVLLIISIGSTYALYQVRYSKRIIYTKVAPFSTSDLDLAIYVDGKPDKLPSKGSAYVDNIECDDISNLLIYWNYDKWSLNVPNIEVPNKCKISFTTNMDNKTLIKFIKYASLLIDDETKNHNLRYIGKSPENYIWFNCDSYDGLTQETASTKCEKWRIIGLMNNMTIVGENTNEENQSLVKIVRADSIGRMAWDSSNRNNWANASLQKSLNGTYYNGQNLGNGKGITELTQPMIEQVTWNIGGLDSEARKTATVSDYYTEERGIIVPSGAPATWDGYIGLFYISDYGYATGGGSTLDRTACLTKEMAGWSESSYKPECAGNSWLYSSSGNKWVITPNTETPNCPNEVHTAGSPGGRYAMYEVDVHPTLYLNSNVKLLSGNGSSTTPYIITP